MTPQAIQYYRLLLELLDYREKHSSEGRDEDSVLDRMDRIWLRLTPEEVEQTNVIGSRIASGRLTANQLRVFLENDALPPVILGSGLFTYAMAGSLTRLRPGRVKDWFTTNERGQFIHGDYEGVVSGAGSISFLDLIDVLVAGTLRENGLSLQRVRKVYNEVRKTSGPHPFARNELLTDGKLVFLREHLSKRYVRLLDVLNRQQVFDNFIYPYLRNVAYDEATRLAVEWRIREGVVVNPRIALGRPVVAGTGVTTNSIQRAFAANNERHGLVAAMFGIQEEQVRLAVEFESRMAA